MTVNELRNTNTIAIMGDGYADNCDNGSPAGNVITYSCDPLRLANMQMGSPLRILANTGVAGATTTQILSQLNTVIPLKPAIVLLYAGINDVVNGINAGAVGTDGTTIDNLDRMIRALLNNGSKVIVCRQMPRTGLTDAQAKQVADMNDYIASSIYRYRDVFLFDMFRYGLDTSSAVNTYTGVPLASRYLSGGVNPNTETALLASKQLMKILDAARVKPSITGLSFGSDGSRWVGATAGNNPPVVVGGSINGFDGDESIISPNPYLTGSRTDMGTNANGFNHTYPADYNVESINSSGVATATGMTCVPYVHTRRNAGRYIPMFAEGNQGWVVQTTMKTSPTASPTDYARIRCNTLQMALGSNPLSVTNWQPTMTITYPAAHGLTTGDTVTLTGATAFAGLTTGNLNRTHTIISNTTTTVTVTLPANANATTTGGGTAITVGIADGRLAPNSGPYTIETELAIRVHSGSLAHLQFRLARLFALNSTQMSMLTPLETTDYWNLTGTFHEEGVFDAIIRSDPFFMPNDGIIEQRQLQLLVGLQPNSQASAWLGAMILKRQ
jgi:GDSL-like Lipase/Acylhydrolase family